MANVVQSLDPRASGSHAAASVDAESLLAALPDGVTTLDRHGELTYANDAAARLFGFPTARELLSATTDQRLTAFDIRAARELPWSMALRGDRCSEELIRVVISATGEERIASVTSSPLHDSAGMVVGCINRFRDVTAEAPQHGQLDVDRTIIRIATAFANELDIDKLVQKITDEATAVTGAQFGAFFFNSTDASGGKYMLYTLSGAPIEAFSRFGMPRATPLFGPTFRGEGTIRSDDVRKDPRYGQWDPHRGMPKGHLPVVSYLAVPVASARGEVHGGLFFGHAEPGRFSAAHERIIEAIAAQAAIALDNANLHRATQRQLEFTRLALAAGKLGTWEWDIVNKRVRWSPEIERMHGIAEGSFDGTFEMYQSDIHPDDRARVLESVREVLSSHRPHYLLYRIVRPDGAVRWLEAHGHIERDAAGQPVRLLGVCSDVTERVVGEETARRLASQLARSEEAEEARKRMTDVLEAVTDPFSVLHDDLTIEYVNAAGAASVGIPCEHLIGKNIYELFPAVADTAFPAAIEKVRVERVPQKLVEYYAPFQRWFESSYYPLRSGGFVSYSRDITALKHNEIMRERLMRQERLRADVSAILSRHASLPEILSGVCQSIVGALDVAFARVWTVDATGTVLELQASAGMYTHVDGPHARVPIGSFKIGKIALERAPHLTNDVLHDPRVGNPEWARRERMVAFAGYPLVVEDRLIGVLALFSRHELAEDTYSALRLIADLVAHGVERKRAAESLAEQARELARSNRELEQFAYVASHDLQEPLRTVSSYVQLIARRYQGKLDPKADEFIAFAGEGASRMQRLIEDLLSFSRVGTRGVEFASTSLGAVLAEVERDLAPTLREAGATVTSDSLPTLIVDRGRIAQLLQNLLSNAVKFHGSTPPAIHVGAVEQPDEWVLSVRDNGIGIEPQYFDRIFVIFQRLHGRAKYAGTGIGLAICKKIVDLHGGRIWVESSPGEGSTFFFTIPKQPRVSVERTE